VSVAAYGDVVLHVTVALDQDESSSFTFAPVDLSPGGSAAMVVAQVAALGRPARLVATIGRDYVGDGLRAELESAGVDCSRCVHVGRTGLVVAGVRGTEHTVVADVGPVSVDSLVAATGDTSDAAFVYVPGFPGYEPLLERLVRDTRVVADFGFAPWLESESLYVQEVLARCRGVAIALLSGGRFAEDVLRGLLAECVARGVELAVATRGGDGVLVADAAGVAAAPAFEVEPVCKLGAGDSFAAGLIVGLLDGRPVHDAVRFGQAVAAVKVTRFAGAAPRAEIAALLDWADP
jgi:sugar/nucleoside kinase (ribokinase family)